MRKRTGSRITHGFLFLENLNTDFSMHAVDSITVHPIFFSPFFLSGTVRTCLLPAKPTVLAWTLTVHQKLGQGSGTEIWPADSEGAIFTLHCSYQPSASLYFKGEKC